MVVGGTASSQYFHLTVRRSCLGLIADFLADLLADSLADLHAGLPAAVSLNEVDPCQRQSAGRRLGG